MIFLGLVNFNTSDQMRLPQISVVTVCYNAVDAIEKTLLSVVSQTYQNIEYIIIDGASSDGTVDVINKYRNKIACFISEPDKGIYDAMNKGVMHATGEWIHFLNAGDTYHDNTIIERFVPLIEDRTQIAYGDTFYIFSIAKKVRKALPLDKMNKMMPIGHPATFVKLAYHKQHLFDTSYKSSGDYKFFYDSYYCYKAKFQYVPLVVADFDAEGGVSTSNSLLVAKEDARLRGINNTFRWKLRFVYCLCKYWILKMQKKVLPRKVIEQRELSKKLIFIDQL